MLFIFSLISLQVWVLSLVFAPSYLVVAFLDVGQGDAIYIQAPNGNDMLIDGGRGDGVLRELSSVMGFGNRDLDVVLATHPDADHIGGLIPVFDRFEVTHFLDTGVSTDTVVYKELMKRVDEEATYTTARTGGTIDLGGGVVAEVLFPDRTIQGNTNNASVILRLTYGETSILLTGDAGKVIERRLLAQNIQSDVLKAGHHGSKTSSDPDFVRAVYPEYVVISAEKDNRYGHPHQEVLDVFKNTNASVLGTYDEGTIVFVSNGETLWLR